MAVDRKSVNCEIPALAIRSSVGIAVWSSNGPKDEFQHRPELPKEDTKLARSITFSPDGKYFAYTNGVDVRVYTTSTWQLQCSMPRPKAFYLKFSPLGTYLVTWELYTVTKDRPEGSNNMFVYKSDTGEEIFSIVQKKQTDWEPSWGNDESIFAVMVGGEAYFYELSSAKPEDGFKTKAKTIGFGRGALSLAPSSPLHISFYTPGSAKGQPSMCKIYKYPALAANESIACKSFFQADRVVMMWNKRGSLLILTSTEVDVTGASYYGNQALNFMSIKGDTCAVTLKKDGPIHDVQWSPKGNEFVVVYGYMPSSATLFNLKCDPIFNFTESPMNAAYFNSFGNLLLLGGFGNLRGTVTVWDVSNRSIVATLEAPDSTYLEWSPSGEEFLTATTAPRLRISNGFKVWHYSGALLHETMWPQGQELYGVEWQKYSNGHFKENTISKAKVEGIKSSQPSASKQVYQPPNVRMMMNQGNGNVSQPVQSIIPGLPPGYTASKKNNKNSDKSKKSRQPKQQQPKVDQQSNSVNAASSSTNEPPNHVQQQRRNSRQKPQKPVQNENSNVNNPQVNNNQGNENNNSNDEGQGGRRRVNTISTSSTGEEKVTRIRYINMKLAEIKRLKEKVKQGKELTSAQLSRVETESQFRDELKTLYNEGGRAKNHSTSSTGDPEKDGRIRTIQRKLGEINKLKSRTGQELTPGQVTKISTEDDLKKELAALKISVKTPA